MSTGPELHVDPVALLEQRLDTALQLSAFGDRVARGELAGVWAVALPREGEAEIVGISEARLDDLLAALRKEGDPDLYDNVENITNDSDLWQGAPGFAPVADKNLSFSSALVAAKAGHTIRREGWNGAGLNVYLHRPRASRSSEPTTVPLFVIVNPPTHPTAPSLRASWVPSQTDMLAEDWLVVPAPGYVG